jgi:hypothetical protein
MKIIFLDIDGVLNVSSRERDEWGSVFHPHLVENLRLIVEKTDAKIVISSSWRKDGLAKMQEMWIARGLPGEVIDTTPSLYLKKDGSIQFWNNKLKKHPTEAVKGYSIPRGCEIEYWLKNEGFTKYEIESWVILDDDNDMLLSQKSSYVQCSGNFDDHDCVDAGYGLTRNCAEQAINILLRNAV